MRECVLTEIVGFWKDVQSAHSDAHAGVRRVVCTHVCMSTLMNLRGHARNLVHPRMLVRTPRAQLPMCSCAHTWVYAQKPCGCEGISMCSMFATRHQIILA